MQTPQIPGDNLLGCIPPTAAIRNRLRVLAEEARKLRILLRTATQIEKAGQLPNGSLSCTKKGVSHRACD